MNITDEMIPVCGDFALESFASFIGEDEAAALEGATAEAKDSVATKIGNMKEVVMEKIKKTVKGKNAEALEKDKKHILMEQAKVAKAAGEGRSLLVAFKNGQISQEEFTERFATATESVRISKAIVGIGKNDELTLQDMQEYTEFLAEAGAVIDEALESLETPEVQEIPRVVMNIDEAAVEGVWNCAYDAYTRNCEVAMEGMNITKKPLTKKEFQAVFNQEKVREDENLRNAIAHGKYSRTELVDMGLLKEDTKDLGKGEYEQLIVDYEKELNAMKGKDEDAKAEYVKKHKLPHHLIHCINGDNINSYEDFIKSAKKEAKESAGEVAEESAKVGGFSIVSKMDEVEKTDKKTSQVKKNEEEAEKVEESIKSQNKQEKMPQEDTEKKAPDKMNAAQESFNEEENLLEIISSITALGDAEAIAAIESLVDELEAAGPAALESKMEDIKAKVKEMLNSTKSNTSKEKAEAGEKSLKDKTAELIEELKSTYEICTDLDKDIKEVTEKHPKYGVRVTHCQSIDPKFREAVAKCKSIIEKLGNKLDDGCSHIRNYIETWEGKINAFDDFCAEESVTTNQEPDNEEVSNEKSTDKKDIDEAAKKFVEKANIVKEHLVELKPRFAKDRKGCAGEVGKVLKEVEDLIPYASEITDSEEKIKAYDHIAQQRAALQKALDNIPPDVTEEPEEKEESFDEETDKSKAPAVEAREDDEESKENEASEEKKKEKSEEEFETSNPEVRTFLDNYRKIIISMKDGSNYGDDNLATNAIQCRSQATDLLPKCNESDKARLETVIKNCETFITRFAQAIKKA